jgi:hypothetical protein
MKFNEGRTELCGRRSKRGWEIEKARRRAAGEEGEEEGLLGARASVDSELDAHPIASGSGTQTYA